ncbi:UNVERIFIED_ORG: copper amine oxidase-like protein [Anoxybacillus amylolyticus]
MLKRNVSVVMALVCSLLMSPVAPVVVYANPTSSWVDQDEGLKQAKKKMESFASYHDAYEWMEGLLNQVKKTKSIYEMRTFVQHLVFYPTIDWGNVEKRIFAEKAAELFPFLQPETERESLLSYAVESFYLRGKETKDYADCEAAMQFVNRISDKGEREKWTSKLKEVERLAKGPKDDGNSGYLDPDGDEQYDPDVFKNPPKDTGNNYKPGFGEGSLKDDQPDRVPMLPSGSRKPSVPQDLARVDVPTDPRSFREDGFYGRIPSLEGELGSSSPSSSSSSVLEGSPLKKETKESPITIQYTLNKQKDVSRYEDTGIRISEDGIMTYKQARDALEVIAIQAKGRFVDDETQALALLEGRLLVVREKDFPLRAETFVDLFDDMKRVGVRLLDTRIGKKTPAVDLVESYHITTIWMKGREVEMSQELFSENSVVLFPLRAVAEGLGASVQEENGTVVVRFKEKEVVYRDGSERVLVNGKEKTMKVAPRVTQKGVRMADVMPMLEAFGFSMEVDAKSKRIIVR